MFRWIRDKLSNNKGLRILRSPLLNQYGEQIRESYEYILQIMDTISSADSMESSRIQVT